jgi:hypothetical protein
VTAILPRPADTSAGPTTDQLRVENTNLRAMVTALVDELVSRELDQARNYAEHPRTTEQLAVIAADARHRYEVLALHAIPAKEKQ